MNLINIQKIIYKSKISKETFWAYLAKFIYAFGGLFIIIFIPKWAGVEIYGGFSLILAYISIFGVFFGAPVEGAIKKEITESKFNIKSKKYFIEGFKLKIIFSICFFSILFFILFLLGESFLRTYFLEFLILAFVMNLWGLVVNTFEAVHRLFFETAMYVIEYSTKVILIIYFYFISQLTLKTILYSFISGYFLAFLSGLIVLFIKFEGLRIKELLSIFSLDKEITKKILHRTFFLSLTGISFVILTRFDTIMIDYFLTKEAVGFYNISSSIAFNLTILSVPIILGIIPLFANTKNIKKLFYKYTKKLIWINLLIFVSLFFVSDFLINLLYGPGFEASISVMKILAIYPLLASLQGFSQQILILKDKTKQIFIFGVIAVITNVVLNIILIPLFGISGAATSTILSYGVWTILSIIYLKTYL